MTNEEAIKEAIKELKECNMIADCKGEYYAELVSINTVRLAIEALQEQQDGDAVHCNRLKVDDAGRVCCVKDTCDGCPHVPGQCVIEDMLESLGIIDGWKRWEMPNYRERKKEG